VSFTLITYDDSKTSAEERNIDPESTFRNPLAKFLILEYKGVFTPLQPAEQ